MTTDIRVTETQVSDGYLSEADMDAASALLADHLMVEEVAEAVIDAAYVYAAAAGSNGCAMNMGGEQFSTRGF